MHRTIRMGLLFLIAGLCAAQAQPHPALPTIAVANSVVPLPGPWRFSPGDNPAWSSPTFDDSAWSLMDLHSSADAVNPTYGTTGYIKGWTARGYPGLSGFAWYRIRIHIANPGPSLAIKMPDAVDDAYQVFANGRLLGSFGVFSPSRVVAFRARPESFALPPPDANGDILLAIRFYAEAYVIADGAAPDSGGMHQIPLIGLSADIRFLRDHESRTHILALTAQTPTPATFRPTATAAPWSSKVRFP